MSCGICLEAFDAEQRRPKFLLCGHTYCLVCLQSLPKKECPIDRKVFEDPGTLPDNFMLLQICERPAAAASRFWCLDCKRVAPTTCEDEHTVCSLRKARGLRAKPCLDALLAGNVALAGLRRMLNAAVDDLEPQVAACRGKLDAELSALDQAALRMTAALHAEEAAFEEAIAAVRTGSLPRDAGRLLAALANPASACSLSVALEAPGGPWRGSVRPMEDAAARLLLCRLLCDDRLQPPAAQAQGDGQEEGLQQEHHGALDFTVPAAAPRWPERSNKREREMTADETTQMVSAGCRVARGRDWDTSCLKDGSPPGPGTVRFTSYTSGKLWSVYVDWDCGSTWLYYPAEIRNKNKVPLKLLSRYAQVALPDGFQKNDTTYLEARYLSLKPEGESSSKILARDLNELRVLVGLHCDKSVPWSLSVLRKAAPNLEVLELRQPGTEHLQVVAGMPRLHSLHLDLVTLDTLQLALSVPSLRRLEVHCRPFVPLVPDQRLRLPVAPALEWLRVGVYPLTAALAVARAHADTLRELELVAASDEPYGCPDLAEELAACGLRNLQKLVLRRDSPQHFCRHDWESCQRQKDQISEKFQALGINVVVLCNHCDIPERA